LISAALMGLALAFLVRGYSPPSAATIVHDLRKPGYVTNVRGRSGGVCMARQAKEINRLGRSARRR
jgi:hypothetical protein